MLKVINTAFFDMYEINIKPFSSVYILNTCFNGT